MISTVKYVRFIPYVTGKQLRNGTFDGNLVKQDTGYRIRDRHFNPDSGRQKPDRLRTPDSLGDMAQFGNNGFQRLAFGQPQTDLAIA